MTLRARLVTLRARWVTLRARLVTLRARWVTLRARWVTFGRYSPESVAEHAVALLLTLSRQTHQSYIRTNAGNFSLNGLVGFEIHGKVRP